MNVKVSKLLNEQINREFYSAYLYLDFANYYASVGLDGFENWYKVQAQEERDHAMLFYQYLQNNGEGVTFEAIAKPEWERGDHMTPLKKALEHEKLVTASIDAIYAAAYEAKDFRAMQMLDWFIKEQGEEEKNAADLITKMELFGGDSKGLYMPWYRFHGKAQTRHKIHISTQSVSPASASDLHTHWCCPGQRAAPYQWYRILSPPEYIPAIPPPKSAVPVHLLYILKQWYLR